MSNMSEVPIFDESEYEVALSKLKDYTQATQKAEYDLKVLKTKNLEEIFEYNVSLINKRVEEEENLQKEAWKEALDKKEKLIEAQIKKEKKERQKNGLEFDEKAYRAELDKKYKIDDKVRQTYEEIAARRQKTADHKAAKEKAEEYLKQQNQIIFGKGQTMSERLGALKELTHKVDSEGNTKFSLKGAGIALANSLASFAKKLDNKIDEIAANKAAIDTRLQGSNNDTTLFGSYWDKLSSNIKSISAVSPYFKQETIVGKIKEYVGQGISYNVEQRAFLQTISDKIATTFNAANGTLLRLIRIQQKDSTAGRLGMESALNAFLNNMYETSEYLGGVMDSVKGSLEESMALMSAEKAVGFEYQVQKWLGSLYSVGMSQGAVNKIAASLGQLAAGDINGLFGNGGTGNLLVMAANESGISLENALAKGLEASDTNKLIQAMVSYLANIYNETSDSLVVQQQMANVFGLAASDLKAAANLNLEETITAINKSNLDYGGGVNRLIDMANSMALRTGLGELLQNSMSNLQYSLAEGIASNPALYGIFKVAGLMEDMFGGFELPFVNAMGFGVDMNTSVAKIMQATSMGASILGTMGSLFTSGGGLIPEATLKKLGITRGEGASVISRGNGLTFLTENSQNKNFSESGTTVGNQSGADIKDSVLSDANQDIDTKVQASKQESEEEVTITTVNENVVRIAVLLESVANGDSSLAVRPVLDMNGFAFPS